MPAERPVIRDVTPGRVPGPPARQQQQASPLAPNLVGPHDEGSSVVLECETSGGYPEPVLSWWRDGKLIDDSYELVSALDGRVLERHGGRARTSADEETLAAGPTLPTDDDEPEPFDASGAPVQAGNSAAEPNEAASELAAGPASATASAGSTSAPGQEGGQPSRLLRNRLELAALTRDQLLANYSCAAWNSDLGPAPTSYVMIDMNRK